MGVVRPMTGKTKKCLFPKRRISVLLAILVILVLQGVFVVLSAGGRIHSATNDTSPPLPLLPLNRKDDTTNHDLAHDCFSELCIQKAGKALARVWQRHSLRHWCVDHNSTANSTTGLTLIKVPKSASSTMAGIVLRIADRHGCSDTVQWQHAKARQVVPRNSRSQQFWVAPIRHPLARALSSVYYHSVSLQAAGRKRQGGGMPSDAFILRQLERTGENYIADYTRPTLSSTHNNDATTTPVHRVVVQEILQHYHFLVVVEELQASLVVWAWLADLHVKDMVIMSSKTTGSWYATGRGNCVPLIPPVPTLAIQDYWNKTLARRHVTDRLLHAAAVHSLHETIQKGMGQALFEQRLRELQTLQAAVQTQCGEILAQSAPCSPTGVYQPHISQKACFVRDFGCGHQCVDDVVQRYPGHNHDN